MKKIIRTNDTYDKEVYISCVLLINQHTSSASITSQSAGRTNSNFHLCYCPTGLLGGWEGVVGCCWNHQVIFCFGPICLLGLATFLFCLLSSKGVFRGDDNTQAEPSLRSSTGMADLIGLIVDTVLTLYPL